MFRIHTHVAGPANLAVQSPTATRDKTPALDRSASTLRPALCSPPRDDMPGSLEVGLAPDFKMNNIAALSLKILCPHENIERRFYGKPAHSVCKFHVVFASGRGRELD